MKIAIIGAGIYGCHIGERLISLGFEVKIYEKSNNIFSVASGNNQYRLHLGFHYARNFRTRQQSRDGFFRFLERYGSFTKKIKNNYYLVPKGRSLIDFKTYKSIMMSSGLDFVDCVTPPWLIDSIDSILTDERLIQVSELKKYFLDKLSGDIVFNKNVSVINHANDKPVICDEIYDYVIDCTWGHFSHQDKFFYEPTILLYYKCINPSFLDNAITLVDGELLSLYPTENKDIFTLSSVRHTPIKTTSSSAEANNIIKNYSKENILEKRRLFEEEIIYFFPSFLDNFEYTGEQLSIKTKPFGNDDDRSCYVEFDSFDKRKILCLSGKIDNLFYATSRILDLIKV